MHTSFFAGARAVNPPGDCKTACTGLGCSPDCSPAPRPTPRTAGYTLGVMEARPGPPPRPAGGDPRDPGTERYGPLELQRLRKDDGRLLIVYERVGDEDGTERPSA